MRKLFAIILVAGAAYGNETSYRSLQSGTGSGGTPFHDHGLHGEGQVVAVLDTGLDYDNCFFREVDGSEPPVNTGSPATGLAWTNVKPGRRKVIAYDFLFSCDQYPGAFGCDDPKNAADWDNQGHGTHAAASIAADKLTPIVHDYGDALATGAKLVIQDAGYVGGDNCSQRPGIGCPVAMLPILTQAYLQGARIHSNSWGDRQGTPGSTNPPTANYSQSSADIDSFVFSHPDMLVVFNTGNYSANAAPPASTVSAPGSAKNTLQVGGTRTLNRGDDVLAPYTLYGPSRDGRIKPDLVGPAMVLGGDTDLNATTKNCDISLQGGTSWASPSIAGAAALARQYYTDGFYPGGLAIPSNQFTPSAALLKATLIAGARRVPTRITDADGDLPTQPVPSNEQGFGFPVLHDVLPLAGDALRLKVADVPTASGLVQGDSSSIRLNIHGSTPLKVVLVWTDPPGVVRGPLDTTPELVNDLDLRVTYPDGSTQFGNEPLHPGQADRLNNVEALNVTLPSPGLYTVSVSANHLGLGPRQSYALVVTGEFTDVAPRARAARH